MGTTITARRLETSTDELERIALEECFKRMRITNKFSVLILSSEPCDLAFKFSSMGALVTIADAPARAQENQNRILASGMTDQFKVCKLQLPDLPEGIEDSYDLIYVRHHICRMPYEKSGEFLELLLHHLRIGGKLFLTAFGIHSELSVGYPHSDTSIKARFSPLSAEMGKKYAMGGQVCLFSERDLILLLLESGLSILKSWVTSYGNVQAVAVRI